MLSQPIQQNTTTLKLVHIPTPLGDMVAIGDEQALDVLAFADSIHLEQTVAQLSSHRNAPIVAGWSASLVSIQAELATYFEGKLTAFKTPLRLRGTLFQQRAWQALTTIPYGQTRSYLEQAQQVNHPSAYRAVAQVNANNQIVIVVPCHRIINNNGKLGGYGGGLYRKQWLLDHEKRLLPSL